ncbi:fumarylacetoacetate hydrolase family protein [Sinomonas sp. ASV486]|uniref:fumarylacetoacetate hydrolase family protein n=1 Tax=Sinomonas sp. ASV486 TaxID=3051170 RepID=UPI0027DB5F36|nr:fumarylacetoacetate hydrolase family protein [Sinomonas sp. ASV486]MDQ4490607.1 fumarylacetoacetate hydrolase family protein [Sinomonas sp. ASV486]
MRAGRLEEEDHVQHPGQLADQVRQDTIDAAGKVIAVHLNYPSRAAQRGRTPAVPSYFLKPATSLALNGAELKRPQGVELLTVEGEVALVIGARARNISPENAWAHVGYVTAANDAGLADLRWADKGSNLRSKGVDGIAPIGPTLLPAQELDPAALRVRMWINGKLAQEDSTATLFFPFAQLVADLSRLMTLEPGDIILSGTPAGATVAQPGDVVEIEVDGVASDGASLTTGRLSNAVVDSGLVLESYGALPKLTDADRIDAWGSPEAAGLPADGAGEAKASGAPSSAVQTEDTRPVSVVTPELEEKLRSVGTATLSVQLRKRGMQNCHIEGLIPTKPGAKVVGTARTLRYIPAREDLFKTHGGGFNAQKRAVDSLRPGDILVMDARGEKGSGTLGDVLALRAQVLGAAAVITDGGIRDFGPVSAMDIPAWGANAHPAVLGRRHVPWSVDDTVACGGAAVQPGDVIVGDEDGIVVIPPALAEEVADDAVAQERMEAWVAERVAEGHAVDGLFPMNAEWTAKYKAAQSATGAAGQR